MILTLLAGLQVGLSSEIYPAASYGPMLAARGIPVAEFNLDTTPVTHQLKYVTFTRPLTCTQPFTVHTHTHLHTPTTDSISRANVELPFLKLYLQMRDNDIYCCPQAVATAELNCTQLFCLMIQFDVQSAYSCALCNTPVVYTMPVFMWTRFLTSAYIAKQISFVAWGGW